MKTRKQIWILLLTLGFAYSTAQAQEFKKAVGQAHKISISELLGSIRIEPSNSNELIIFADDIDPIPERADGLKPLYNSNVDNTGIGLEVKEIDGVLHVLGASPNSKDASYIFKIPANIKVKVDYHYPMANDDIFITDISNEIEVKTLTSDIQVTNVTGPLILSSTSGDVEVNYSNVNQDSPSSISSISGFVDVTLPSGTKAELHISTISGAAYSDIDLEFNSNKNDDDRADGLKRAFTSGSNVRGKMNGGGVAIKLQSISGNVYLRKK